MARGCPAELLGHRLSRPRQLEMPRSAQSSQNHFRAICKNPLRFHKGSWPLLGPPWAFHRVGVTSQGEDVLIC